MHLEMQTLLFYAQKNDSCNSWSHYESKGVEGQFFLWYPDVYKLWEGYTKLAAVKSLGTQNHVVIPNVTYYVTLELLWKEHLNSLLVHKLCYVTECYVLCYAGVASSNVLIQGGAPQQFPGT